MSVLRVVAVQEQRSRDGYWTHPHYFTPAEDTERPGEFNDWLIKHGLEFSIRWMRGEAPPELILTCLPDNGNVSRWQPVPPPGSGWFIGSLHNTEQGAVCIWLRCLMKSEMTRSGAGVATGA
ncbi:hypothetical protein [Erwinia persicina]|uniref:hypothetical protein n=1 Tax=Erwinia persicina TaxID=55211 RepID=UPI001780E117|nr:hypothetical protein [Erwinia persicina]MBD8170297.1 hypothetical protein [Erwinia persicina]